MTSVRRAGRAQSYLPGAAVAATLFLLFVCPVRLAGQSYQVQATKEFRITQIHSWLSEQDGMQGADDLARSILQESEKNAVDPVLILAIIQIESRFNHKAVSP